MWKMSKKQTANFKVILRQKVSKKRTPMKNFDFEMSDLGNASDIIDTITLKVMPILLWYTTDVGEKKRGKLKSNIKWILILCIFEKMSFLNFNPLMTHLSCRINCCASYEDLNRIHSTQRPNKRRKDRCL